MIPPEFIPHLKAWRFKLASIAVLLGLHLWLGGHPQIMQKFGVGMSVVWFRDTHSMLAASDSAAAGLDPFVDNPYDVAKERHIYPDWWYALGKLGLTRQDYFWLGAVLVALFWLTVLVLVPVRSWREAGWLLAVCASPPFWLVINRANPDLLIFILLTGAVWLLASPHHLVRLASPLPVALAVGLKFYPVLAGAIFLQSAGSRRENRLRWAILAVLGLVLVWSLADDVQRYLLAGWVARGSFSFGAAALPLHFGLGPEAGLWAGRVIGAGLILWGMGRAPAATRLPAPLSASERQFYLLGAAVLAGSFFLTVGYLYKIVFALWLLPACFARRGDADARQILLCLVGLVWVEGLACAAISLVPALAGEGVLIRRTAAVLAGALAWALIIPCVRHCGATLRAARARLGPEKIEA
jgi:hypothetical protein